MFVHLPVRLRLQLRIWRPPVIGIEDLTIPSRIEMPYAREGPIARAAFPKEEESYESHITQEIYRSGGTAVSLCAFHRCFVASGRN